LLGGDGFLGFTLLLPVPLCFLEVAKNRGLVLHDAAKGRNLMPRLWCLSVGKVDDVPGLGNSVPRDQGRCLAKSIGRRGSPASVKLLVEVLARLLGFVRWLLLGGSAVIAFAALPLFS